jgi:4a-hydroxytetrahydrobiopterin dehydratase
MTPMTQRPSRQEISDAVDPYGWRLVLGKVRATVPVGSLAEASGVAAAAVTAAGADADDHLYLDLRPDGVTLTLRSRTEGWVTPTDLDLVRHISAILPVRPDERAAQVTEIAIDALDIAAVRPFWREVLGYVVVPPEVAAERMRAALAAGGRVAYDAEAPAFWVLADPEGNEACLCTWQGRD